MTNKQHNQNHSLNKIKTRGRTYKEKGKKDSQEASVNPKAIFIPKSFEQGVPKLPTESPRQYESLRLYCQKDSLVKVKQGLSQNANTLSSALFDNKGNLPSLHSLERWSKRFNWVERKENWVAEECRRLAFVFKKQRGKIVALAMEVELHQDCTSSSPKTNHQANRKGEEKCR